MIKHLKRHEINEDKYNYCISNSKQSNIFGYSWYLDIVADNWDVLVLGDYEAVMPLPWRQKLTIKYIYPPFWLLELGIYSLNANVALDEFLKLVFKKFNFVDLRMNIDNQFSKFSKRRIQKQMQYLSLETSHENIQANYNRNRKRELNKAKEAFLFAEWNDSPEKLVNLFKKNVGKRVAKINEKDYEVLETLLKTCIKKGVGEILSIYDVNKNLVASAFFLKHQHKVTELIVSTDFSNREGANTFLNDCAILKYTSQFEIFNFGGSSMEKIANYYKSFGASTITYDHVLYRNFFLV